MGAIAYSFALSLLCLISSAQANIRCLECTDMPHPQDCLTVSLCTQYEICYVEQYVTSGGFLLYNSGCLAKDRCPSQNKRGITETSKYLALMRESKGLSKRQDTPSGTDIPTCIDCCGNDFCNTGGCGEVARPMTERGPFCFNCEESANPDTCRLVTQCEPGEVCAILKLNFYKDLWTTMCKRERQCHALVAAEERLEQFHHDHQAASALVGKRLTPNLNMASQQQRDVIDVKKCPRCCNTDFCNNNCYQQFNITDETTTLMIPTHPSTTAKPTTTTHKPTTTTHKSTTTTHKPTTTTHKPVTHHQTHTPKPTHAPTTTTHKPPTTTHKPTTTTHKPVTHQQTHTPKPTHATTTTTHKPTTTTHKPTTTTHKPTTTTHKPTTTTHKPTTITHKPTTTTHKPTTTTHKPTTTTHKPTTTTHKPTTTTHKPTTTTHKPTPTTTTQKPTTTDPKYECESDDYVYDAQLNLCLRFYDHINTNWTEAKKVCQSINGTLVVKGHGDQKMQDVLAFYDKGHHTKPMWVGATTVGSSTIFIWDDGTKETVDSTDGKDLSNVECLYVTHGSYKNWSPCSDAHGFICERVASGRASRRGF
ncbi:uncharacterized protein LOC128222303 [Mya arenaria]|uniref:uncharacterized protein LOC128222303 n=1 Tax=Mya arenaria TaxID=6604 RepID=UPI0022E34E2B|nr:uncharacterized protein LOC128222303 [Mya arenaria]